MRGVTVPGTAFPAERPMFTCCVCVVVAVAEPRCACLWGPAVRRPSPPTVRLRAACPVIAVAGPRHHHA